MKTRTITLELLRHGPAHNQLLSPLTPYIALSGSHAAETVHIDIEHHRMLRRLRGLRYQQDRATTDDELVETAEPVSRMLREIRGLSDDLAAARSDAELVHLELVFSAAELAMLPFELAGAGASSEQWLSLQSAPSVVVTRRTRHAPKTRVDWSKRPTILFAAASPPEAPIPDSLLKAHYQALGEALLPWLVDRQRIDQRLVVLPRASLASIRHACQIHEFSHIHIVAHGITMPEDEGEDLRYGLALHADRNESTMEIVSGRRLADALRASKDGSSRSLPALITLASCDAGNQGSVIAPGASIAHKLHEMGVPLVIGSQLPLSEEGSRIMTEIVYKRVLHGDDPRSILSELRSELRARCRRTHDWASLVAYASLPADIASQLREARRERAKSAVDVALARMDYVEQEQEKRAPTEKASMSDAQHALEAAIARLYKAMPRSDSPLARMRRAKVFGLLGNAKKRWAEHLDVRERSSSHTSVSPSALPDHDAWTAPTTVDEALAEARADYREAFRLSMSEVWALVQSLALDVALGRTIDPEEWSTASVLAHEVLQSTRDPLRLAWAHAALAELAVIAQLLPEDHAARHRAKDEAHMHIDEMLKRIAPSSADAYSTRRQLDRYASWWWRNRPELCELPRSLVMELHRRRVPSSVDPG